MIKPMGPFTAYRITIMIAARAPMQCHAANTNQPSKTVVAGTCCQGQAGMQRRKLWGAVGDGRWATWGDRWVTGWVD